MQMLSEIERDMQRAPEATRKNCKENKLTINVSGTKNKNLLAREKQKSFC